MKKPEAQPQTPGAKAILRDPALNKKFPQLVEHLTCDEWEDGTARETSTISIFAEQGAIKLALNDRAMKRSAYLTAETLEQALHGLETGLAKGTLDWRQWGARTKKK